MPCDGTGGLSGVYSPAGDGLQQTPTTPLRYQACKIMDGWLTVEIRDFQPV